MFLVEFGKYEKSHNTQRVRLTVAELGEKLIAIKSSLRAQFNKIIIKNKVLNKNSDSREFLITGSIRLRIQWNIEDRPLQLP